MVFSNAAIDRLGNKIRMAPGKIDEETLAELQQYRTSHEYSLSKIFSRLCEVLKNRHGNILTYRIKRFESIIGKLNRLPNMRFSQMGDIGGCRIIVQTDEEVYSLVSVISKEFQVKKINDYIKEPQDSGYSSVHLYTSLYGDSKTIEIQLRTEVDHNWATLVEITDVLYDVKLKEYGDHDDFKRFHYLLSFADELTIDEKKELVKLISRYKYVDRLSEVFGRNYIQVRKQWLTISGKTTQKYFLIETTKDQPPRITSYSKFADAENRYFELYKSVENENVLLTHLPRPTYDNISIGYSNYILTFHTFIDDCYEIFESLLLDSVRAEKYYALIRYIKVYYNMLYHHSKNLITEISEIRNLSKKSERSKRTLKAKERELEIDLKNRLAKRQKAHIQFNREFQRLLPKSTLALFVVRQIVKIYTVEFDKKMRKLNTRVQ